MAAESEFRLWTSNTAKQLTGSNISLAGILAADRAHHLRPDLRTADRRKRLFRQPRRVRRRGRIKERRVKRLALMDQDGANVRYLTKGLDLVLTPRFSPSTQEITYMEFGQGDPRSICTTSRPASARSSAISPACRSRRASPPMASASS